MCFPGIAAAIPYIAAGVGAASAGLQYAGQRRQAQQQAAYQAQAAAAERQRSLQEQTSLRMRQAQEQEATARELEQVSRKSREALARFQELKGGVTGASLEATMNDYLAQEAGYRAAVLRQQELGALGTGLGLEQAGLASQQRLISIRQPIDKPSPLAFGLRAISGGLSGYAQGQDIASRMGGTTTGAAPIGTISGRTASYAPGTVGVGRYDI
jgi:hypothetical protein